MPTKFGLIPLWEERYEYVIVFVKICIITETTTYCDVCSIMIAKLSVVSMCIVSLSIILIEWLKLDRTAYRYKDFVLYYKSFVKVVRRQDLEHGDLLECMWFELKTLIFVGILLAIKFMFKSPKHIILQFPSRSLFFLA
jgi:hypothetical protein